MTKVKADQMSEVDNDGEVALSPENRWRKTANLMVFIIGLIALVIALNFFAQRESLRQRFDATKTRAYSLSDQTQKLLGSIQGQWKIAIVMSDKQTSRAMRKQIDEVLKRYTDATSHITVRRIDPDDPATLPEYEAMLADLQEVYKDQIKAYDQALDAGEAALQSLHVFSQQRAAILEELATRLPADFPDQKIIQQKAGLLGLLADQGQMMFDPIRKARKPTGSRPLPDYEGARSILATALSQWASNLDELATIFGHWQERLGGGGDQSIKQFAATAQQEYRQFSQKLAEAADPLKRLPLMELTDIGATLEKDQAAVVIGPTRAAVIPSSQLFPKSNIQRTSNGGITFDERFRGEHLISSTIRSLMVEHMPLVVFVHAEESSMLRPRDKQADLVGVANVLRVSRIDVKEWMVGGTSANDRPSGAKNQPIVWVIVPPSQRSSLQMSKAEASLLTVTSKLIEEGEPVLLSVYPSLMPRYGQADPWAAIAQSMGLHADTSQVVYERVQISSDQTQNRIAQLVNQYQSDHPIARALDGEDSEFDLPVPVQPTSKNNSRELELSALAVIAPTPDRWLEKQWTLDSNHSAEPTAQEILKEPVAVVYASQRTGADKRNPQRMVFVGAGNWMLSYRADLVQSIGGDRMALVYPGNNELLLASTFWLAGMDDLIAASPMSQDVARLRDITPQARQLWFWILVCIVPATCIGFGVVMWYVRRR